jgi:ribonuclease BN (tRNA processing enzyme)
MRVVSLGTGMFDQRKSQAAAWWLVEFGNSDKFLFDLGTVSVGNLSTLEIPFDLVNKVLIGHLHSGHVGDFAAWPSMSWPGQSVSRCNGRIANSYSPATRFRTSGSSSTTGMRISASTKPSERSGRTLISRVWIAPTQLWFPPESTRHHRQPAGGSAQSNPAWPSQITSSMTQIRGRKSMTKAVPRTMSAYTCQRSPVLERDRRRNHRLRCGRSGVGLAGEVSLRHSTTERKTRGATAAAGRRNY